MSNPKVFWSIGLPSPEVYTISDPFIITLPFPPATKLISPSTVVTVALPDPILTLKALEAVLSNMLGDVVFLLPFTYKS